MIVDDGRPFYVDYSGAEIHAGCVKGDHVSGISNCTSRAMRGAAMARYYSSHDAYTAGIAAGWQARNFQDAYGGTCEPEAERIAALYPGEVAGSYYRSGFELGAERFERGEWQDGSPIDDGGNEPDREPSADQERAWDERFDGTSFGA